MNNTLYIENLDRLVEIVELLHDENYLLYSEAMDIIGALSRSKRQYDEETQIALIWSMGDVQGDEVRPDLNDEQAMHVLREVKRRYDCEEGVHWYILKVVADELYPLGEGVK